MLGLRFNIIISKQQSSFNMQNQYNLSPGPRDLMTFLIPISFWNNQPYSFLPQSYKFPIDFQQNAVVSKENLVQTSLKVHYKSQSKRNIILNTKNVQKSDKTKISDCEEQITKIPRKCVQKETRNVSSNLLRIFLKNLIQSRTYTQKINSLSVQLSINFTSEQFYQWIEGFGINFKNYIRLSQLHRIMKKDQPKHFRRTFLILLRHYSRDIGLLHCLTSKRIERHAIKMHLEGLRSLEKLLFGKSLKN